MNDRENVVMEAVENEALTIRENGGKPEVGQAEEAAVYNAEIYITDARINMTVQEFKDVLYALTGFRF